MGLFDFIGGKIQQAGEDIQAAKRDAEKMDEKTLCEKLQIAEK